MSDIPLPCWAQGNIASNFSELRQAACIPMGDDWSQSFSIRCAMGKLLEPLVCFYIYSQSCLNSFT
jgi:hypothetical protein